LINPYDQCVANKIIDGKQCMIVWHVDDLKISHVDRSVVEKIVSHLNNRYGKEEPISVNRGKVHDYLGMQIDFSEPGKVKFIMIEYIKNIQDQVPGNMSGTAATPAGLHLYDIDPNCKKLDEGQAESFHHITAQLLYLCKCT